MIRFKKGNIFDEPVEAIVNTVNLVGVMGKGIALQFKERFKKNFKLYKDACRDHTIAIGRPLVVEEWNGRDILVINFPTKIHWRNPSEYEFVSKGLAALREIIETRQIKSIAIPPLGAGNGGLDWERVKPMIMQSLSDTDCDVVVLEPGEKAESVKKSVRLTRPRALLLYMLDHIQHEGYEATAFSAVKSVYFMQKFGADDLFKLKFVPYVYGPYCDAVRHVLHGLDGAYVFGFADMTKKPFEPFGLVSDRLSEVKNVIEGDAALKDIVNRTMSFLDGYWDDFSLELLSSVDYLFVQDPSASPDEIHKKLCAWSERKGRLFADKRLVEDAICRVRPIN
ncbi:MAG: macro domain-containing protein [Duncaniella sp.]|nr:macro domain-containing protein [Duncaniella sp.]